MLKQLMSLEQRADGSESMDRDVIVDPREAFEEEKTAEEQVNEAMLCQAIIKRHEWSRKYKFEERVLFELFSEFSSMMMINRHATLQEKKAKKNDKMSRNNNVLSKTADGSIFVPAEAKIRDLIKPKME